MAELILVIPMYKVGTTLPATITHEISGSSTPSVVLSLLPTDARGTHTTRDVLDLVAARGAASAADVLASSAADDRVWVDDRGAEDLDRRPDAVSALLAVSRGVAGSGCDCVVLCPWWSHPDDEAQFTAAVEAADRVVAVGAADEPEGLPGSLLVRVAAAIAAAKGRDALFVLKTGADPALLAEPFSAPGRTTILVDDDDALGSAASDRLRAWLGRPPRAPRRARSSLPAELAAFGLPLAHTPEPLRNRLVPVDGANTEYAFGTAAFDPLDDYLFHPALDGIISGDWHAELRVSAAGHGINSYAHSYVLVDRGLAVVAQVGFGMLADRSEVAEAWGTLMSDVEALHQLVVASPLPEGRLLLVASSDIRGIGEVGILDRSESEGERRSSLRSVSDPFLEASRMLGADEVDLSPSLASDAVPAPEGSARAGTVEMWDHVLAEWMLGREVWREPEFDALGRWFDSYSGVADLRHYPDPYVGDLAGSVAAPRVVVLGLNPGVGYDDLQARGGAWAEGIREQGYSKFHDRIPFDNPEWTRLHGRNSPYWRNLVNFARRWTQDPSVAPTQVLNMELYPWHSDRVEGAFSPPAGVLDEHVWRPLADVGIPTMFAFGRPWLDVCRRLGHRQVTWLGEHAEADEPLDAPNWNVVIFELPSGQHVVTSWQSGYAGPPGLRRLGQLREALHDRQISTG